MTCREKLKMDHPDWTNIDLIVAENECPSYFGYLPDPGFDCLKGPKYCAKCWSREIPEEPKKGAPMPEEKPVMLPVYLDGKITPDLAKMTDEICNARRKLIDNGFNKEETFWIIKTILERVVK